MVISRQLLILAFLIHTAVIAAGEIQRTAEAADLATSNPAPVAGAIYLDAWQIEKEFLLTPLALQQWLDLGIRPKSTLSPKMRISLKPVIGQFLATRCPVLIREEPLPFTLDRIHFIQPDATEFTPIPDNQPVAAEDVWISVVFSAPQSDHRQALQLLWDLIPEDSSSVTVKVADPEGTRSFDLTRLNPALNVRGRFRPDARTPPPSAPSLSKDPPKTILVPWLSVLLLLGSILGGLYSLRKRHWSIPWTISVSLMLLAAIPARHIAVKIRLGESGDHISNADATSQKKQYYGT